MSTQFNFQLAFTFCSRESPISATGSMLISCVLEKDSFELSLAMRHALNIIRLSAIGPPTIQLGHAANAILRSF
jgi:hypothetical protein